MATEVGFLCDGEVHLDFDGSEARTEGLRKNAGKIFTFKVTGREAYSMMSFLAELALELDSFDRVEYCVLLRKRLREQLIAQGF